MLRIVLKNFGQTADNSLSSHYEECFLLEVRMSSKQNNGQKKKLTKKELKAQNHAKLMAQKGGQNSNVVDINAFRDQQNKKAA